MGTSSRIIAVIQARLSSKRFPWKILYLIQGQPMLRRVIMRAELIPGINGVVVATSDDPSDNLIADLCATWGIQCFRGALHDVLGRYEMVARRLSLRPTDLIMRLTADCPGLDPKISYQVIQLHLARGPDYAGNTRDWPDGLDTEVFTRSALRTACDYANCPADREHVTPWMRQKLFSLELPHAPSLRAHKWSVDTEGDLEYVRELYAGLGPIWGWRRAIELAPETICSYCNMGYPHPQRAWKSISGAPDYTIFDLHEVPISGGAGYVECTAHEIVRRQVAGLQGATDGAHVLGADTLKNPDGDQASPQGTEGHSTEAGARMQD